ncbi:MAG: efflux RND transporter permease subunit [Gemmatimonadetes bacterium]|nr:efflux RND transporter permease subunit [Gemmatimonadota bacterium]
MIRRHASWRSGHLPDQRPRCSRCLGPARSGATSRSSGISFVYIIFEDGTDLYWARSRVLEYLNGIQGKLPANVTPTLGPDATGLGWVFQYALEDTTGHKSLAELRSIQDWYLRYALTAVPGVSEVATLGGFEKQYQIDLDPAKLLGFRIPITAVMSAIQNANADIGAMVVELSEREYMVRGLGYLKSIDDIENVVVGATQSGIPVRVAELGRVSVGPAVRRGVAELRARRRGGWHRGHAVWPECPRHHRTRQGQDYGGSAGLPLALY